MGSLFIVGTTSNRLRDYRANYSGKSGCFFHAIIESAFISQVYPRPPRPDALKNSWLPLIATMESTPGVQMLVQVPLLLFVSKRKMELVAFSFINNVTKIRTKI